MDPHSLFRAIESLDDLQMHEPRFGCGARAHKTGRFLATQNKKPGRIWALPQHGRIDFLAPLLTAEGKPFPPATIGNHDGSRDRTVISESGGRLKWKHHVAAADVEDWYNPMVYDPIMFNGPVTLARWMSVFDKQDLPRFVKTEWGTAPVNGWMGSTFSPGYANEHDVYTDDDYANSELREIRSLLGERVRYRRHHHSWRTPVN